MSRRYIKSSKINQLDQVTPEIVAVVSAKDNIASRAQTQKYFKRNYLEAIRQIVPDFYFEDEVAASGTHISYPNQLINSHILANKHQSTILPVSSLTYDHYLSAINTPSGFAKYFYKHYNPAQITPDDFQRNILFPLKTKLSNYSTSQAFIDYVSGTLLPSIPAIATGYHETDNLATLTVSAYANDSSGTYKYLANNLGWLYFLNREGPTDGFDPSAGLATLMTNTFWRGRSLVLEDVINIYQEYLWKNQPVWGIAEKIIPTNYVSGVDISAVTWTSGTQLLDRLKTLNKVVYSPHYLDSPDTAVEDAFYTYLSTSTPTEDGSLITTTEEAGPLTRFLEAMSFSIADRITEHNEIDVLYDIGKCPDEFLELLAELIGWKFIGADVDKWRVQLRNAVEIYKMKGTKRSIQILMDTLFSTGVFNVTTSDTIKELWESYIPDLMYYALATSSPAFVDFDVYTPELARQFGVPHYSASSMETNIKYTIDKILFDLTREFPNSFYLGGKPFPQLELVSSSTGEAYTGPYHILPPSKGNTPIPRCNVQRGLFRPPPNVPSPCHIRVPPPPIFLESQWPVFKTGSRAGPDSEFLQLKYDPTFMFFYRDKVNLVPPYENRQYYTATKITENLLERIEYYLICYGVDKAFAKQVVTFCRNNLTASLDADTVINSFLLFTKTKQYPPNYTTILRDSTKQRLVDPIKLLSLWNGKSSHFIMSFEASSFDWDGQALRSTTKYGIQKVLRVLDQVIPAHAIPKILVSVSDVADTMDAIADKDCREWRPNFTDLGSSDITTNYAICAVDMESIAVANGIPPKRFKRGQVNNINDVLFASGVDDFISVPRNSLRRRSYHNLLPETKFFTRNGRNNPGSLEMSSPSYYSSSIGYLPLGFIPSSLQFQSVALRQNPRGRGIGKLIDYDNLNAVWDICQNLLSPSSIFGYDVSNTFASRAKQIVATSDCNTYGRRGQLQEIIYTMNKIHNREKYLQASSIVSGYLDEFGVINPNWPTSSTLIQPTDFSAWYNEKDIDVVPSIANSLLNQESSDESLTYYEDFAFGSKVHKLYNVYNSSSYFSGHGLTNNYNLLGVPNFFSHTFGPLIYNSNFDIDGSTLGTSGYLAASAVTYEVDLSYYGGSGVLSLSGVKGDYEGLGTYAASTAGDVFLAHPEFRNSNIVSAVELVDTSAPYTFGSHPIFSVFKLSRDDQSKYAYSSYLINNQIIKYHRSTNNDLFPRLRIKIDNSNYNNKSRNFLEPNHEYEVTVKAHNLDVSNAEVGGLKLGLWVRTEPENDEVWSHVPAGAYDRCGILLDNWEPIRVADLSSANGINLVSTKADYKPFHSKSLNSVIGSGVGASMGAGIIIDSYDFRCWEPMLIESTLVGTNPQAIANAKERTRQDLTFRFTTENNRTIKPTAKYLDEFGKVHRTDQKYVLEFFVPQSSKNASKFIVFEDISIKDLTNYNNSVIKTKYGEAQLDSKDLKSVFRFFKDISTGFASRNSAITSGTMEVSGGSRMNYRSNKEMYTNEVWGEQGALILSNKFGNFVSGIEIHEG